MKKLVIALIVLATIVGLAAAAIKAPRQQTLPQEKFVPGMLIVKLKPELRGAFSSIAKGDRRTAFGLAGLDGVGARHGVTSIVPLFYDPNIGHNGLAVQHGLDLMYVIRFAPTENVASVLRDYRACSAVAGVMPNVIKRYCATPDDPSYSSQWALTQIHAAQAWDITQGDSTVVLAIVDSGCDWTHQDLRGNTWVNPAEDINHNGTFDDWPSTYDSLGVYGDLDGIDNDGNGLVDDVIGWDFTDNDNNPYPDGDANDHGTHCNGCADATTNNGIGVAGTAWNCRRIAFRCVEGTGIGIVAALNAIYYATAHRATAISMSWGSYGYWNVEQEVMDYAHDNGTVMLAAAGNDNVSDPQYPACYSHIIAVGASAPGDARASFSNNGSWIGIMSPGQGILSTTPNNTYQVWDGTSMATPIVAGVVGLIRSAHPGWTNTQIETQLLNTADNINAQNPGYAGKLGTGRVNAYRAVSELPRPRLAFDDFTFTEEVGNGDSLIEAGETVGLTVNVRNSWGDALQVQGTLQSSDPFISVTSASSGYGSIEGTINGGQARGNNTPFTVAVSPDAPGHTVRFSLHLTATGYDTTVQFDMNIGRAGVLFVNDGEGQPGYPYDETTGSYDFGERPIAKFYTNILDSLGYAYDVWSWKKQETPPYNVLNKYGTVLWTCEWTFPTLDTMDIDSLRAYLNHGGSLLLTGQDIGFEEDYNNSSGDGYLHDFYGNYLQATFGGDQASTQYMVGVAGDPIGDSIFFDFWQPYVSSSGQWADYFAPAGGATPILQYDSAGSQIGGIKYAGPYRLVYFAPGLESVNNNDAGSVAADPVRTRLGGRMLRWLNGNINIVHATLVDCEDTTVALPVTARITAENAVNLSRTSVYWMRKSEGTFHKLALVPDGGDPTLFHATIPAFNGSDSLFYFVYAEDTAGYSSSSPLNVPRYMHALYIGPDLVPPQLSRAATVADTMDLIGPYAVGARVTDNLAVDTSSILVHFYRQGETEDSSAMAYAGGSGYTGQLAFSGFARLNQRVYYYFSGRDRSLAHNRNISPLYSFNLKDSLYYDDFTTFNPAHWDTAGGWADTAYGSPPSPPNGVKSQHAMKYSPGYQSSLTQLDHFDLRPYSAVQLRFKSKRVLDTDADIRDTCYVLSSNDSGATWVQMASYTGNVTSWTTFALPFDSAAGFCAGPQARHVQVKFYFKADPEPDTSYGWFVDDIKLKANGPYYGVSGEPAGLVLPSRLALSPAWPNPMSAKATCRLQLPARQRISLVVYNVLGQQVRTLVDGELPAGTVTITWDGADQHGRRATNGVYFYQLRAGNEKQTQKIVIIR